MNLKMTIEKTIFVLLHSSHLITILNSEETSSIEHCKITNNLADCDGDPIESPTYLPDDVFNNFIKTFEENNLNKEVLIDQFHNFFPDVPFPAHQFENFFTDSEMICTEKLESIETQQMEMVDMLENPDFQPPDFFTGFDKLAKQLEELRDEVEILSAYGDGCSRCEEGDIMEFTNFRIREVHEVRHEVEVKEPEKLYHPDWVEEKLKEQLKFINERRNNLLEKGFQSSQ